MRTYLLRRLLFALPTLLIVTFVIFFVFRLLPGDAALLRATEGGRGNLDPVRYQELREELGLNRSVPVQYGEWIWDLVRLNGGTSLVTGQPVFKELGKNIPVTLELTVFALFISLVIGIPVGVLSAAWRNSPWDYAGRVLTTAGLAMPSFLAGSALILILIIYFNWLPPLEYKSLFESPWHNLGQFIWPALVLGMHNSAVLARITRSSMLEILRQDYVRTAHAKGLHPRIILERHALRNALLPVVTIIGIQAGTLMGGSVITETIFVLPGVGTHLVDAISLRDWVTVQTIVTLFATVFLLVNILVDLLYGSLDPRIRYHS